jgi:hypothetical protein
MTGGILFFGVFLNAPFTGVSNPNQGLAPLPLAKSENPDTMYLKASFKP